MVKVDRILECVGLIRIRGGDLMSAKCVAFGVRSFAFGMLLVIDRLIPRIWF